jgi:aminoglycoside phosphotransferase (APT) family kinase protein
MLRETTVDDQPRHNRPPHRGPRSLRHRTDRELTGVSITQATSFLTDRFDGDAGDIIPLRQGGWSTAYAFRHANVDYVIRFNAHLEDFVKDRRAATWSSRRLPIPAITEIGEAFDAHYAISERVSGGFIDDLDEVGMRAMLPSLFAALDAARQVDLSNATGYGGWDADGHASFPSWREYLVDVAHDHPFARGHGWRERLERSAIGAEMFDEAFEILTGLVDRSSQDRHLIHSDLLNYNLLVSSQRITGVIDWGCSLYGDFLYDVAWFTYYWPWRPAWKRIGFAVEAMRHYAKIGLDVPRFEERLRCYQIHIGLGDQSYNAYMGRWDLVEIAAKRTLAIARRDSGS